MSLYTLTTQNQLPKLKPLPGLHIEASTDLSLLSQMAETSKEEIMRRLTNDNIAFVAFVDGQPAAFGWMAKRKARIGELNHEFLLPMGNRYLWNFRTLPAFRGRGIYPLLLQYIIHYESGRADRFWIIHAPENKASLNGIRKAGFRLAGQLYVRRDGTTGLEAFEILAEERELIKAMNFEVYDEPSASCWNCSSPYLKKRTAGCCCADAGRTCISYGLVAH